jgi:hypothetical protein
MSAVYARREPLAELASLAVCARVLKQVRYFIKQEEYWIQVESV